MATRLIHPATTDLARPDGDPSGPTVRVRGLRRAFGDHVVLDDLDLDIAPGELVALLGRSGSGKSTLLRTLAGLDPVTEGTAEIDGTVSVAFQEPRLFPWRRVADNVALALRSGSRASRRQRARETLDEVGLGDKHDVWPVTLSGGQAQRASLARALVSAPGLLLLDEPFSALDALTRIEMHDLVLALWREHRPAVLLVTHDVDETLKLADRVLVVDGGRIRHESRVDVDRPRDPAALHELRTELLAVLGVHEGAEPDPAALDRTTSRPRPQERAS
ncbi:sulfonate transport system ATP-binding protein [Nocardioides scoriae]|uniref:Sulfonate transport system ATP-binding protein n=1 Tax=Nocardioides scoriae TaxID=642780 RepID=A0A1H1N402_9ACTN|nr:ABC transporter ATP-binding protein [Nocardioides scoriae]SDR93647.1 sulfonate transport system ATP-binding protein [Nocardioides scoriae]